jgi:hypothetical protein
MKALIIALVTGTLAAAGNGQGKCKDIPVTWSLSFTYDAGSTPVPAAIYSDGAGSSNPTYVNGIDGVNAIIHLCSGTNDATLDTAPSTNRKIGWNFGQVLATNNNTPSWSGTTFYDHSFLNIRNILYTPPGFDSTQNYTFTTRMASQLNNKGTNSVKFHLRMENPYDQAVTAAPADPSANTPFYDVLVTVQHLPATSSTPETWVAYPDPSSTPAQVGTLLQDIKPPQGTINVGEYSMPFKFTISRM